MAAASFIEVERVLNKFKKFEEEIKNGMLATKEIALDFEENDESCQEVKTLKDVMLDYAKFGREMTQWDASVRKTMKNYSDHSNSEM